MTTSTSRSLHCTDTVARIMVWPVATVPGTTSLQEVAEVLAADHIGAVGVVVGGHLAGVLDDLGAEGLLALAHDHQLVQGVAHGRGDVHQHGLLA